VRRGDRCSLGRLFDDAKAAGAVRGYREHFEPGPVERRLLALAELEVERNRRVHPDTASTVADIGRLFPRKREPFVSPQFNDHDNLDVSEHPVVELNLESSVAVDEGSQRVSPFRLSNFAATVRLPPLVKPNECPFGRGGYRVTDRLRFHFGLV